MEAPSLDQNSDCHMKTKYTLFYSFIYYYFLLDGYVVQNMWDSLSAQLKESELMNSDLNLKWVETPDPKQRPKTSAPLRTHLHP